MASAEWHPRGAGEPAVEIDIDPEESCLYLVECSGVRYSFREGSWAAFGRDDDQCTITVWECLRESELSRVAGVLWCVDSELWVRNLSQTHELIVSGSTTPQHLPPRRANNRGSACTVPAEGGAINAPTTGDWRLVVTSRLSAHSRPSPELSTITLTRPPEPLLATAVALCAPLLRRGTRPATYQEIAAMTGTKPRTARDRVDRLVAHYADQGFARLWQRLDSEESHYAPLARLLVYRSVVTRSDLALLKDSAC